MYWPYISRLLAATCCAFFAAAATDAAHARRIALVIGNADYKIGALQNPVTDAVAVAQVLEKELRFDKVILKKNVGFNDFRAALKELSLEASGADIGVVYFAGHGMEVNGKNFLIPVDASLGRAGALDLDAIALDAVLGQLEGVRVLKLVILDACRNNPFATAAGKRAVSRGLARIEPEESTLVIYAAKDGTTADDGAGRQHSPFTEALLNHIATPGLEVQRLFGRVGADVMKVTHRLQQPQIYGTLGDKEYYLHPKVEPAGYALAGSPGRPELNELERAWALVKDSASIAALEAFRQQYGAANAFYDRLAADRLDELRATSEKLKAAAAASQAPPPPEPVPPVSSVSPELTRLLQAELKRVGCDPGAIDGKWGDKGEAALARFARYSKLSLATDEPSPAALEAVKSQGGRICPLECGPNRVERNGICVATSPPHRPAPKAKPVAAPKAVAPAPKARKPDGAKSGMCWAIERHSNTLVPCSDPRAGPKAY